MECIGGEHLPGSLLVVSDLWQRNRFLPYGRRSLSRPVFARILRFCSTSARPLYVYIYVYNRRQPISNCSSSLAQIRGSRFRSLRLSPSIPDGSNGWALLSPERSRGAQRLVGLRLIGCSIRALIPESISHVGVGRRMFDVGR
jgi:hypothetical protein